MDKTKEPRQEMLIRKLYRGTRIALGLSQIALAKSAGLSREKLARWENGQVEISEEESEKLGTVLNAAMSLRSATMKAIEVGLPRFKQGSFGAGA